MIIYRVDVYQSRPTGTSLLCLARKGLHTRTGWAGPGDGEWRHMATGCTILVHTNHTESTTSTEESIVVIPRPWDVSACTAPCSACLPRLHCFSAAEASLAEHQSASLTSVSAITSTHAAINVIWKLSRFTVLMKKCKKSSQ